MKLLLLLLFTINIYATELNSIIIEETPIQEKENVKKHDNKSTSETIDENTTVFIRKSGGIGSNILFYIDSSTSSQVSLSIEEFDYTTPSLAQFTPTAFYFGVFDNISINKDDNFKQNNTTSHSANINFSISNKTYLSTIFGTQGTLGKSLNDHIKITKKSSLDIGGVLLESKNNFDYIDFNENKRKRNNSNYTGGDFYIKYSSDSLKLLNYFIMNKKGTPGSDQFERLEANSSNIQNLFGISYNKEFNNFNLQLKFSENYKNYLYIDNKPPIISQDKIEYNLISNTISSSINLGMELSDFSFIDIKLSNLSYLAESRNYNSTNNIPQISEFHTFLAFKNETYFLDESLIFNLEGRYYVENLYQYSLQGLYYINKNILIKILTKKGLRIPYLEEKYWQSSSVIGNSNLLPETIYKNLISLQFKYSKFNLETELYYSILKDNIIFSPISFGLVKAINTQEATAKGINIISDLKFKHIKINNITSYNKTIYKETKKDVPQTPKLLNKFNILLTYKDYSFNINYTYTSKYYNNIFNTDIIPQKHLISINLNYIFDKKGSNLGFKINNLTNELKYYDSMHIPLPGRTYFLYLNFYFL